MAEKKKKLVLSRETIRTLREIDLQVVMGGTDGPQDPSPSSTQPGNPPGGGGGDGSADC